MHKFAKRADKYEGYPALQRYSEFYNGNPVPSLEKLEKDLARIQGHIWVKKREFDAIARVKEKAGDELADPETGSTLRMCFRRTQQQLMHDIKELETERDRISEAATAQAERLMRY